MEDLRDIMIGKNFKWEGNLEDGDESKVRIYFKVADSKYENGINNVSIEIDKITTKNRGYYTHINSFCNSGKDAINDREYLQMIAGITSELINVYSQFGDLKIIIKSLNCSDIPQNITESKKDRLSIRNVVKDIIKVFKENDEGVYFLPEEISDEMTYVNSNLDVEYTVEFEMVEDFDANEIYVDGDYYPDEDTLVINVRYNPDNKLSYVSELIGELNDIVAHEFTHMRQSLRGYFDDKIEEPKNPLDYYSQPHEIEAQVQGFKRKSKIKKEPISNVIDKWFEKYKLRHGLSDEEVKKIKEKIMSEY